MLLVDANILMYAAGGPHPSRDPSLRFLERVALGEIEAAPDAEVLQEVLHRYRALDRWEEGKRVYDEARTLFPVVFPITASELDRARELLDSHADLMARDALHAAVVETQNLEGLCSFDRDFDRLPGLRRVEPT